MHARILFYLNIRHEIQLATACPHRPNKAHVNFECISSYSSLGKKMNSREKETISITLNKDDKMQIHLSTPPDSSTSVA
jgi:hypothetical protein